MASFVWQRTITRKKSITKEDIDNSVQDIIDLKGDFYFELFNRYATGQKQLMRALAKSGEHIFSTGYVRNNKLNSPSSVQKNIMTLLEDGIADKTGSTYYISDPFFRRYLQGL